MYIHWKPYKRAFWVVFKDFLDQKEPRVSIKATFADNSKTINSQRLLIAIQCIPLMIRALYSTREMNQKLSVNAECLIKTGEMAKTLNEAMPINSNWKAWEERIWNPTTVYNIFCLVIFSLTSNRRTGDRWERHQRLQRRKGRRRYAYIAKGKK